MVKGVKLKKFISSLFSVALIIGLTSCATTGRDSGATLSMADSAVESIESAEVTAEEKFNSSVDTVDESIIQTGNLRIRVKDATQTIEDTTQIVAELGGSIENQYVLRDENGKLVNSELELKIPAKEFVSAFERLAELGQVLEDQRSASDVTLEHTDLQARIAALETSIERLTQLMETAETTSDLLEAEAALSDRQQQLDSLQAQLQVLEDQISFSRIWLSMTTTEALPGGPGNFIDGIVAGFKALLKFVAAAAIAFGVALPWLVTLAVIVLIIFWIIRLATRGKRQNKTQ